jgi:hypothetical protein
MFLKNYKDKVSQVKSKILEGSAKKEENDEPEELPFIVVNEHQQVSHLFDKDFQELDLIFEPCEDPLLDMLD